MSEIYCKAPWVGVTYMPNGEFTPCCAWGGPTFTSRQEMTDKVGGAFLRGEVPTACNNPCKPGQPGWRDEFKNFPTDYKTHQIHFLDFRNNNLCNLKCRSCGPGLSTSWASEMGTVNINLHRAESIADMDLSHCKKIYFAGGEPLLNSQHYEILQRLIDIGIDPVLMYSTNMTVLGAKNKSVKNLWPHFSRINVHASIDAVGIHAEFVRSGSSWKTIESNLSWMRTQSNVNIKIGPVISAINIWWFDKLLDYFAWVDVRDFEPVLANIGSALGITVIPKIYRGPLIDLLSSSKYAGHGNMATAISALQTLDHSDQWYKFLCQQLILDNYRSESWFNHLPVKHDVYKQIAIF